MLSKQGLRTKLQKRLGSQTPEERKRRSLLVGKKLWALGEFKKAKSVCFYVALPTEVDTVPMIRKAIRAGKRVVVPLSDLENKELKLYEIKNPKMDLKKGAFGILEPLPSRTRVANSKELDLVVVPGVAFDKRDHRLGRGKGFYDRFLGKLNKRTFKIGLGFSFQVVPTIPAEGHDVKMDLVLTD